MLALPIFTTSRPVTIVGANELNFCVRDGNRWTLIAINTNSFSEEVFPFLYKAVFADFCYSPHFSAFLLGDPYRIRTLDPLIKSQLLYQLS